MHSPQKSYPLLQVQLKTELFTIILTASSIMFIQSKKKKKLSASIFTEAFTIGEDKSDTVCWSNSQATTRERSNVLCNKNGKLASNLSGITGEDFVAFSHTSKRLRDHNLLLLSLILAYLTTDPNLSFAIFIHIL